jgi:hypothetical protein
LRPFRLIIILLSFILNILLLKEDWKAMLGLRWFKCWIVQTWKCLKEWCTLLYPLFKRNLSVWQIFKRNGITLLFVLEILYQSWSWRATLNNLIIPLFCKFFLLKYWVVRKYFIFVFGDLFLEYMTIYFVFYLFLKLWFRIWLSCTWFILLRLLF